MGIPKFFRWLSGRYPLVCERVSDDNIPEFDNLYLDMNGIIHNCTHPKDGEAPAPATDEERFLAIFYYIDFLFNKIRPQKIFFLGIDGVAPRAKMNEQRARRFRTARELEEQHAKDLAERRANGEAVRPEDEESNDSVFDPTCITPGTEFMAKLTEALRYYINKRVSEDANWRKPQIILSAPNVPGEGEHKIMDYIRFTRAQPDYCPNIRHCLYGLDADLIMLSLLSHEPHFSLLREEVLFGASARKSSASADPSTQAFYLLHISILRDYLDHEFSSLKVELGCSPQYAAMERDSIAGPVTATSDNDNAYDLERIIDDYVLMIMLVGNDFLPTLPKLSINGGALNFMFATYTRIRPTLGGYLHDNGILSLDRLEIFMREIAKFEVDSFKLEVADHQWYQVYKHKAALRGEAPDEPSVVQGFGDGGNSKRRGVGHRANRDRRDDFDEFGCDSVLGEVTTPIKGNKPVISKSQQEMLELIRRFAQRALPKVAVAGHKVQMQYMPGPATALDSLIVSRAAALLGLHVGHEYAHDGSLNIYVAAGSSKAIAKLELEDTESTGDESAASGAINFVAGSTSFHVLGALEDDDDDSDELLARTANKSCVPDFVEKVSDISDEAAVAEYVSACMRELDNVLVVPDAELDMYTHKGDVNDFWQRFELWKAAYYGSKLDIAYEAPNLDDDSNVDANAGCNAQPALPSGQRFRSPPATVEPMCRSYIGSLQWVLQYYYCGCQSWSWYYPYHYAPCISDICANLAAYKVDGFANDEPYTPYEQLMCVLPPYSRKLLPPSLRSLMVDIHSPIRDMYPTSFSVDMNGKKMAWEAVVLIEFVDVERIRNAMKPLLPLLSEDEQKRNSRGNNMAYSYTPLGGEDDADDVPQYMAPDNLRFPPIRPLRCKGIIYIMPSLKAKGRQALLHLVSGLIRGATTRAKMRSGFPSLFTVPHTAQLAFNGTEAFGFPSRDESLVVEILPNTLLDAGSAKSIAGELLKGKHARGAYHPRRLFVAWPYLRDAVLVGVSDEGGMYTMDANGSNVIYLEHGVSGGRQIWIRQYMDAVYKAKKTQAILVSETSKVLLHVLHLRGLQLFPDGSLVRDYGFSNAQGASPSQPWAASGLWSELGVQAYPSSLVSVDLNGAWVNNPRFMEHDAIPLEEAFAVKDRAFFLGRTPLYGSPGKVIGHSLDGSQSVVGIDMQLVANVDFTAGKHENFLGVNALAHQARVGTERYKPSYIVARELDMSSLLLSRITSKMMLLDESKGGDSARVHIGLDLKFEAKRLKVSGYTKRGSSGWLFSDRAVDLLRRYKSAFPDMFAGLESTKKSSSIITVAECFGLRRGADSYSNSEAKTHASTEAKRVRKWLKENIDRNTMVQVPIESDLLSREQIDAIAAAHASTKAEATKKVVVRGVQREAVLRPCDAQYILRNQALMVGHRVVYVSDRSGSVPFGAKGFIVGIHARENALASDNSANSQHMARMHQEGVPADMIALVEIMLDKPFIDGTTLDGRCPAQRGALVPPHQVLDLTTWGLGQSVSAKSSGAPRSVDMIRPAPDTVKQKHSATTGQTADMAAKARVLFNRNAGVAILGPDGRGGAVTGVRVPEPSRAPWADRRPGSSQQAAREQAHAASIMSQLTGGKAAPTHSSKPVIAAPAVNAGETDDQQRAQSIINTLLAGPMERLKIGGKASGVPLASHPPVAGQCPLVIEEEYLSDSMDEDEGGRSQPASPFGNISPSQNDSRFHYDYSKDRPVSFGNPFDNLGRGRGRGRGYGHARGRGGRGAHAFDAAQTRAPQDSAQGSGNWRGRGRGRGGRGGRGGAGLHTDA